MHRNGSANFLPFTIRLRYGFLNTACEFTRSPFSGGLTGLVSHQDYRQALAPTRRRRKWRAWEKGRKDTLNTFGVEEEFFLLDGETGLPAVPRGELLGLGTHRLEGEIQKEWLACQIEFATGVCQSPQDGLDQLRTFRRKLASAAQAEGLMAVGLGAVPAISTETATVTDTERYQRIAQHMPGIAAEHYLSGQHIHVGIENREDGIVAMNALRPWLPLLLAISANSPYWRAADTGFASWRTIQYRRWSVQGIPPAFKDSRDYDRRLGRVLASDVVLDSGHVGWAMRLSENQPTVEIRVADSQMRAADSVLLALLVRGLVDQAVKYPSRNREFDPEFLDIAFWQAAKHGLDGPLLNPWTSSTTSTEAFLQTLLTHIEPALRDSGDYEYVRQELEETVRRGNGARRQRQAFAQGSLSELLQLARHELEL
ncbi:YbdK family carboxylate-amine ligase [Glutamicibacter sp. V16R2B1]|nr:YbdK family carboxylate-amine ligase [Glutamicibacter sp. V16R2B1]